MNATEIAAKIKAAWGPSWQSDAADGFSTDAPVGQITGVAVAWTPTIAVLRRMAREKANFLVSKEGPFWVDAAPRPERLVAGPSPTDQVKATPLYRQKHDFIVANHLAVWRCPQAWSDAQKGLGLNGVLSALGWQGYAQAPAASPAQQGAVLLQLPPAPLHTVVKDMQQRLGAPTVRALGDPGAAISRVTFLPGFVSKSAMLSIVHTGKLDAVVCGEGCEWEAFPYAEDWITAGGGKAMIMTGLAAVGDAGARGVAEWLGTIGLGVPVTPFATGSPFTAALA